MTTAHRPTFDPARGKEAQRGVAYHQRLLPAHTQLKTRKPGQGGDADAQPRDLRAQLLEAEAAHFSKGDGATAQATSVAEPTTSSKRQLEAGPGLDGDGEEDIETKRRRVLEETRHIDADSDISSSASSEEDSDDEEDETAELLRELEKIKKERAEKQAEEERVKAAAEQDDRERNIALGNPLLNPYKNSETKRRWDEDVVFRNQARGTENKGKKEFVNDLLRSDFHKRFMNIGSQDPGSSGKHAAAPNLDIEVWIAQPKITKLMGRNMLLVYQAKRSMVVLPVTNGGLFKQNAYLIHTSSTLHNILSVGQPGRVLGLSDAISRLSGGRTTIAFVDNGMTGGDISSVIDKIDTTFREAGKSEYNLARESDLLDICPSFQWGTTGCFGAIVFHSSPTEPAEGRVWSYNVYLVSRQRAIDLAIASRMPPSTQVALQEAQQYPYVKESEEKRERDTRMS
ncbi:MAG: hypothetical protein Q9201_007916, partial [Fulgogasparrea decipioides]